MLIVNTGSVLLILWQDSANIIYQKTSTGGIVAQQAWYVYYCYMSNCIKLSAVSGCLLILSASVITEEPYNRIVQSYHRTFVPSYYRTSCYRSHRAFVCAYIHSLQTVRVLQQRCQPQVV